MPNAPPLSAITSAATIASFAAPKTKLRVSMLPARRSAMKRKSEITDRVQTATPTANRARCAALDRIGDRLPDSDGRIATAATIAAAAPAIVAVAILAVSVRDQSASGRREGS